MTIAIFSDIHANLPALEAVFAELDRRKPDMMFCLGDLVGYAPWPNEVVSMIREHRIPTIAGNYDEGVGLNSDDCGCAYKTDEDRARGVESIAFTNSLITDDNRDYLRDLPRHIRLELGTGDDRTTLLMVHGSPRKINEYLTEDRPDSSFNRMMETAAADVMIFGHTHKPFTRTIQYERDGEARFRRVINTGSVGKPKDGDPRACLTLLELGGRAERVDTDAVDVTFVRVPYDVEKAAAAVEATTLPNEFADMLRKAY
ncbi:MAG: metallophosphoesterase family protein [bacterium]|nr:metallophosphoesterase family protein [Candidatus Kapabacteria bacterium]